MDEKKVFGKAVKNPNVTKEVICIDVSILPRVGDSKFILQSLTTLKMRKKQSKKLSQFLKAKYFLELQPLV